MSDSRAGATCGCCQGTRAETPRPIENRAGLASIAYRAGDFLSFKRSMFAALTKTRLTTRDDDDFSIAILDAWTTAADVLTFYQERIANESYLGTAQERLSVLELARLIGYELAPGVAANVLLAFNVDTAEGSPKQVTVDAGSRVQSVPGQNEEPQTFETVEALDARVALNELRPQTRAVVHPKNGDTDAWLEGTTTNLRPGDGLLFEGSGTEWDFKRVATVEPDFDRSVTHVTWGGVLSNVPAEANAYIFVMREQATLFGANAADPRTLSTEVQSKFKLNTANDDWLYAISSNQIDLDGSHRQIRDLSTLVLVSDAGKARFTVTAVNEVTVADYAMVGKATRLTLSPAPSDATFGGAHYRTAVAFGAPEKLDLGESAIGGIMGEPITLDRAVEWPDPPRRRIIVSGVSRDELASEPAEVVSVDQSGERTILTLGTPLKNRYERESVRIVANVAPATHGETVRETLGSGDAATPFQTFTLSHKPLTYVYAPKGTASTLQVFVNDILWHDVATLFGAGPRARVYVTMRDDDGTTTVQFGDGSGSGSRLPTGNHNVRAVYRKGLGEGGNVGANKITLLMSHPLGLAGVENPMEAEGGAAAEQLADARVNAPRTVLTLDRVVSLLDYQSYAASSPGIAKALATWTMVGTARQIVLTVAGPHGEELSDDSPAVTALAAALAERGDPYVPLQIVSFDRVDFHVEAEVRVEKDRVVKLVLDSVRAALAGGFSFEARSFGEPVDLSDVFKVIQGVDGVAFVDINVLDAGSGTARQERLPAAMPRQAADGTFQRAQILVLKEAAIKEKRLR